MKTKALLILFLLSTLHLFGEKLPDLTETTDPGTGSILWIVDPNLSDPKDRKITVPNLRTEMSLSTVAAAETLWGVNVIVATEIDTIGEIETLAAGVNILLETEIDASAELKALMDDETGTGGALVFAAGPTLSDVVVTGSLNVPNAAAPTTDAFGEVAGDNNAWAASRGTLQIFDGTANTWAVNVLASDTPSNGQVPKFNTGGTITWEDDTSGGTTAINDIGDASADGTIAVGAHEIDLTSTIDASGEAVFTITNTDASSANDNSLIDLRRNDADDANSFYLRMIGDNDGTPSNDFLFSQTGFTSRLPGSFGTGNGQIDFGTAGVRITSDGDGAMTWLGLGDGNDEDLTWNLDDVSNSVGVSSSTGVTVIDWGTIGADYDSVSVTLSTVAGAIDAGGATSLEVPNGANPTTDAFGEIAADNDAWAASRGALEHFDGTASTFVVATLASDAPSNGQVPKWNTGGTVTWEDDNNSGSNTTIDALGDAAADGTIAVGAHEIDITSTIDASGEAVITILNTDATTANDNSLIDLRRNDGADANAFYLRMIGDNDGTPTSDYLFSQTGFTSLLPVNVPAEAYDATGWNGDTGAPQKDAVRDQMELKANLAGPTFSGTVTVGTLAGAIDAGAATSLEIPNGNDPDLTVEGQVSYDANGDVLRGYDGANQVALGRKFETYQATVIAPNDLADAQRDAFFFFSNNSGMSFIVTEWFAWSTSDDTDLNIETTANDGSSNATVDAVTIATNGTGIFTGTDSTITAGTIANGSVVWLDFDDTDTPALVHITIKGYYNADVN